MKCEQCDLSIKDHKWAKIQAHAEGWYEMKDGRIFCPNHRPEWAPKLEVEPPH